GRTDDAAAALFAFLPRVSNPQRLDSAQQENPFPPVCSRRCLVAGLGLVRVGVLAIRSVIGSRPRLTGDDRRFLFRRLLVVECGNSVMDLLDDACAGAASTDEMGDPRDRSRRTVVFSAAIRTPRRWIGAGDAGGFRSLSIVADSDILRLRDSALSPHGCGH